MILLDTHVALWIASGDDALGHTSQIKTRQAFRENHLFISAISFWEIALLISKDRLQTSKSAAQLRAELIESGVTELPLTGPIALASVALVDLHGDPADRFIAATALVHNAALMTADQQLLRWRNPVVRLDARK